MITKKASNQSIELLHNIELPHGIELPHSIELPHDTSLMLYADSKNYPKYVTKIDGVYAMTLPLALCRLSPAYYRNNPLNVEIALKMLPSVSNLSRILLEEGLVT